MLVWVRRVLLLPAIAYLVVVVLLLVFEKRLIFFPQFPGRLEGDWSPPGLPYEDIWITTADGVRLNAWWIKAQALEAGGAREADRSAGVPTFLCFHGNASNVAERAEFYAFLRRLPANVLAVEYRGYGKSEGSPSEDGIYRDAEASYNWLTRERRIPARQIIALGQSLGTAVAAQLASHEELGGVVLEAPFPSARAVARRVYWFIPGIGWLIRSRFQTTDNLRQAHNRFGTPLLVIHCTADPVIPFEFGKQVYDAAAEPKWFLAVSGQCHEEASYIAPERVKQALAEFIEAVRLRKAPRAQ